MWSVGEVPGIHQGRDRPIFPRAPNRFFLGRRLASNPYAPSGGSRCLWELRVVGRNMATHLDGPQLQEPGLHIHRVGQEIKGKGTEGGVMGHQFLSDPWPGANRTEPSLSNESAPAKWPWKNPDRWDYTHQCSGATPRSVLRGHSRWCWRSNLRLLHKKSVVWPIG